MFQLQKNAKKSFNNFMGYIIISLLLFFIFLGSKGLTAPGAPKAPSDLIAKLIFVFQNMPAVALSWQDNSYNEDGFIVERQMDGKGAYFPMEPTKSDVTTFIDASIIPNHDYCYRVYAFNTTGGGDSGYTNVVCATIPQVISDAPSNLAAFAASNTQIRLTWQDNSNNEDGFGIEYQQGTLDWSFLTNVPANETYYTHSGLITGQDYCYRIYSYNSVGQSTYSNVSCAIPVTPPTGIQSKHWQTYP